MLIVGSALKGYALAASDGRIGTVKTFLFDDTTWQIRWLVIDTGTWLSTRRVLVHPAALGTPDHERQFLPVRLSKAQIEASPDLAQDRPVTMQMETDVYSHYDWDPHWGPSFYGPAGVGTGPGGSFSAAGGDPEDPAVLEAQRLQLGADDGDPHLRDMTALRGYHIHASDGSIGHVENFLIDDADWGIRYLIVDTRNWWPGARVLIAPYAVKSIEWTDRQVRLNVTQHQVRTSPAWDPVDIVERDYQRTLHSHYRWPGYGW
jgi:hypothetical protein